MIRQAVIVAGLVCLVLLLAACGTVARTSAQNASQGASRGAAPNPTQSPTGDDHLGRYAARAAVAKGQAIDVAARRAILSEPAIRFPARIGLARLDAGAVSPVPQDEAEAWLAMVQDLGPGWGELVPIGPLEIAAADLPGGPGCGTGMGEVRSPCDPPDIAVLLGGLRRAALHRRLDAVLVYELVGDNPAGPEPSADTELAPVAALLRLIGAGDDAKHAQGLLMDARHGAVYGFAVGAAEAADAPFGDRTGAAVAALTEETGAMLRELRIELAEARAARAEAGNQSGFRSN